MVAAVSPEIIANFGAYSLGQKNGQAFKDWTVAAGKTKNTSSNYFTGVNIVSRHCGREVFDITDIDELEPLYRQYGPQGLNVDVVTSNSGNVHSGLRVVGAVTGIRVQHGQEFVGASLRSGK
jgi:hypothetical protein